MDIASKSKEDYTFEVIDKILKGLGWTLKKNPLRASNGETEISGTCLAELAHRVQEWHAQNAEPKPLERDAVANIDIEDPKFEIKPKRGRRLKKQPVHLVRCPYMDRTSEVTPIKCNALLWDRDDNLRVHAKSHKISVDGLSENALRSLFERVASETEADSIESTE